MSRPFFPPGARTSGAPPVPPGTIGVVAGTVAALIWAVFMVFARTGTEAGLLPQDFVALRFGTAALLLLPWLIRHDPVRLAGIGWRRAFVLTLFAGPLFILMGTGGYHFAPLAHGAVIQPATITLAAMAAGALLFKERITPERLVGAGLIIIGLVVIASHGDAHGGRDAWIGDLLFIAAGLSWTGFTLLLKRWRLDPVAATAAVSTLSALVVVPAMLIWDDTGRIGALPVGTLILQLIVQGALAGVLAVIAFATAVRHLGAPRAALFPAIVPAATLLAALLLTGQMPTAVEALGAGLATFGLLCAIGLVRSPFASARPVTATVMPTKGCSS